MEGTNGAAPVAAIPPESLEDQGQADAAPDPKKEIVHITPIWEVIEDMARRMEPLSADNAKFASARELLLTASRMIKGD